MRQYKWFGLLILISLLLALVACGGNNSTTSTSDATAETPAGGSDDTAVAPAGPIIARIGWAGSPDTLNPGTAVLSEAYTLFELVYDSMFQLNLDGTYSPELAESWTTSPDGTVWTFKIRQDMTWHDGEKLTAQDIAFSYNMYQSNEDFAFLPVYTEYFDSVEAPDDTTVVITLSEAIPNMESQLVFLYVVPEHIWSQYADANAAEFENTAMIGSGPFKMSEYQQNQFVRLTAVKDHPLYPPKIDEVVFQTFDNQDALVQAIRTGQVDMITEMPATAVPTLRNEPNIVIVNGPPAAPGVTDIIINLVTPENCPAGDGTCSGHPALLDRNVRLALAHATDKQKMIDIVLLGFGAPGLTLIPDSLGVWYNDSLQDYPYDIDLANQVLDDAGYLDTDGDGIREMPDGTNPLIFRLNWPSDSTVAPRMAEIMAESWGQIGIKAELQALDPDTLTSICCPAFDYDVLIWGWGSDPDPAFLLSVMTTDEIPTGTSETGYSNPDYDALYKQQATTLDPTARKDIVWEMQRIVFDDIVYIIPFYSQAVQAYRSDRFTGWITDQGKIALEDLSSLWQIEPVK